MRHFPESPKYDRSEHMYQALIHITNALRSELEDILGYENVLITLDVKADFPEERPFIERDWK